MPERVNAWPAALGSSGESGLALMDFTHCLNIRDVDCHSGTDRCFLPLASIRRLAVPLVTKSDTLSAAISETRAPLLYSNVNRIRSRRPLKVGKRPAKYRQGL